MRITRKRHSLNLQDRYQGWARISFFSVFFYFIFIIDSIRYIKSDLFTMLCLLAPDIPPVKNILSHTPKTLAPRRAVSGWTAERTEQINSSQQFQLMIWQHASSNHASRATMNFLKIQQHFSHLNFSILFILGLMRYCQNPAQKVLWQQGHLCALQT